ncbi:6-pyruvoyl tetrahydropterin synthase domain-containing protein [Ditylenchus destructor]|uniref:6-pyruvoyl tetrahydrobiopterin synthase n=1 Tax=Ditylenchus destructor TaxID=166010 RepID=A0AAD4N7Y0_9BILA|nr:6-pyruvoyl tetrahydropterin synthase domain-containing protein [Ditylenchus destructor]
MCRKEHFSAAHRLHNTSLSDAENLALFGKCNNPNGHGHNYEWEVVLEGLIDQRSGMVYNLETLKREMAEVLEKVDHKNLDVDVPYFRENKIVSTTENLAVYLYEELKRRISQPELLKKVIVHETNKNSFTYRG